MKKEAEKKEKNVIGFTLKFDLNNEDHRALWVKIEDMVRDGKLAGKRTKKDAVVLEALKVLIKK